MTRLLLAAVASLALASSASAQRIRPSPPPTETYISPWTGEQPLVYKSGASYRVNPLWYPGYDTGFGGPGYQFKGTPYNGGGNGGIGMGGGWYNGFGNGFYGGIGAGAYGGFGTGYYGGGYTIIGRRWR